MAVAAVLLNLDFAATEVQPPPQLRISQKFDIYFARDDRDISLSSDDRDIYIPDDDREIDF